MNLSVTGVLFPLYGWTRGAGGHSREDVQIWIPAEVLSHIKHGHMSSCAFETNIEEHSDTFRPERLRERTEDRDMSSKVAHLLTGLE